MLRILHTGDLHLGSPMAGFSLRAAAARRERQFAALEKLVKDAVKQGVSLLLFAGDCFDSITPDTDTVRRFFRLLEEAGVPAVIAPGNHDYYLEGGFWDTVTLPQNVYLFREEGLSFFDFPSLGVTVYGYAFCHETMAAPSLGHGHQRESDRIPILLAHSDILSPLSPYAPLSARQLEQSGFSYAALGHIHKPQKPRRFGNTVAAYCGFLAGRGFDEVGAGHANLLEFDGNRVTLTPVETAADVFLIKELDVTGTLTGEELLRRVSHFLATSGISTETALRLSLVGEVSLGLRVDTAALSRCGEAYALFEVKDCTMPLYDAAYLEKDPTLRGAFYRAMLPQLESEDEHTRSVAAAALRMGLSALSGKEVLP